MRDRPSILRFICIILFISLILVGCAPLMEQNPPISVTPVQERYAYTQKEKVCYFPSFTNENEKTEILSASTEDGFFVCMTTDEAQADSFINAQRTLLHFLQTNGVEVRDLNYVAINFDDNFSESEKDNAYIALSSTKTWQQVLVTLHALWGDFTDYGYVYAMANAIATYLGWKTEVLEGAEPSAMDAFFLENPNALNLLYPAFTERFATEQTILYSKLLSLDLFEHIDLCDALIKPIASQLDAFDVLLHGYSEKIGALFSRQACGYAYRGPYMPLCIQTTYATHIVDHGYKDYSSDIFEDYFCDYVTIYQTAEILDEEIVEAVAHFDLEERAGNISINWLSEYSAMTKFAKPLVNTCYVLMQEAYVTTISLYQHAYYYHLAYLINPELEMSWQTSAFCEIGRSYSQTAQYATEKTFTRNPKWTQLFYSFTGHTYQTGTQSYFEVFDVLCYALNDDFSQNYHKDGAFLNSIAYYLIQDYGINAVTDLMLFPDTVVDVTGKTWETLENEWKQSLINKYADKKIPSWLIQDK